MATRYQLILRDALYVVVITILLLPGTDMNLLAKIGVIFFAIALRVWQHVGYYRLTGKIY